MTKTERPLCPSCEKPVVHREGLEWCQDHQMSEATLQKRVVDRAKRRGWKIAHAGRGIAAFDKEGAPVFVTPMSPGWPDLFLVKPKSSVPAFAVELKRENGVISPEQWEWIALLNAAGIPCVVWKPSDLRLNRVRTILDGQ